MAFEVKKNSANVFLVDMVRYFALTPTQDRVGLYLKIQDGLKQVLEGRGAAVQRISVTYHALAVTLTPPCMLEDEVVIRIIGGYLETLPRAPVG